LDSGNEELGFFEEATSLIYKWLSEEERMQLHREFHSEEVRDITELEPELRFFRLLHFIQVKYIKAEEWVRGISDLLETISSENPNFFMKDVTFKDTNDEDVSLVELREKLSEARPQVAFANFLRQLGLQEEFERYLVSSQRGWPES
jgi:hypothetical protein